MNVILQKQNYILFNYAFTIIYSDIANNGITYIPIE